MAKGFGRVAEAMAIAVGGAMEGYGKGTAQDYLQRREEYHNNLKMQREAAMAAEDRAYRTEEAEKGRGFQREMAGEERAWDKEKFALEQEADIKKMQMQHGLSMKLKLAGDGKPKEDPAAIREAQIITERLYGKDATPEQFMESYRIVKGQDGSNNGIERTIVGEDGTAYGVTDSGEVRSLGIKARGQASSSNDPRDFMKDVNDRLKIWSTPGHRNYSMTVKDPESAKSAAAEEVSSEYKTYGIPVPGIDQDSKTETKQPQEVEAPATSTQGDKPTAATPQGAGTESNPFVITNEAEREWVEKKGPPGKFVRIGDQIFTIGE